MLSGCAHLQLEQTVNVVVTSIALIVAIESPFLGVILQMVVRLPFICGWKRQVGKFGGLQHHAAVVGFDKRFVMFVTLLYQILFKLGLLPP